MFGGNDGFDDLNDLYSYNLRKLLTEGSLAFFIILHPSFSYRRMEIPGMYGCRATREISTLSGHIRREDCYLRRQNEELFLQRHYRLRSWYAPLDRRYRTRALTTIVATFLWQKVAEPAERPVSKRAGHTATVSNNLMVVTGGVNSDSDQICLTELSVLDLGRNQAVSKYPLG